MHSRPFVLLNFIFFCLIYHLIVTGNPTSGSIYVLPTTFSHRLQWLAPINSLTMLMLNI
jgi:hypothetical protein